MRFQFWSIGKNHEAYVERGIADFTSRISNYYPVAWKMIPVPRNASLMTESDLKKKEGESVLKLLGPKDYLVTLDDKGKMLASDQLATFIQHRANESTKLVIFLIGGAYGIDESVFKRSDYRWSLSPLTFPHQLVRLILAEQVYRACTIIRNEKYHHI